MEKPVQTRRDKRTIGLAAGVVLALVILILLMIGTVVMHSVASGTFHSDPPFALSSLISDAEGEFVADSFGEYVMPAFIGLSEEGTGLGLSTGDDVLRELYTILTPCIAGALTEEPVCMPAEYWTTLRDTHFCVYIRYHSDLPVPILQAAAAEICEMDMGMLEQAQQTREMFILLPEEGEQEVRLVLRDMEGVIWQYSCVKKGPEEFPTLMDIQSFIDGFSDSFYRFVLGREGCGETEPVFLERVRIRNVKLSAGSAVTMVINRPDHLHRLLRLFQFNPDKLNSHEEADGTYVVVENHGVFRLGMEGCIYTASAQGGVSLQNILGYRENYTIYDGLYAAGTIAGVMRNMHRYYLGGDASLLLTEVGRQGNQIRFSFRYCFDNIPIGSQYSDDQTAMELVMEGDKLVSVSLRTIAIGYMGDFNSSYLEAVVVDRMALAEETYTNVTLVYPADFTEDSLYPMWMFSGTADPMTEKETGGDHAAK